jgi:hypothetical protein
LKIGRNDPCACGSAKKFKNCCGRPATEKSSRASEQEWNEKQFERAMDWINERLCEEGVPFPERSEAAVRLMSQVARTELNYPVPEREPDPGSYEGENLAVRVMHWYRHKYPEDLLTPGLKIETEGQFQEVMEQIDNEARSAGMLIQGRPMHAWHRLSVLTKSELKLVGADHQPAPGSYAGDDLVGRVKQWYDERYGNRLHIVSEVGRVAFLIRGDIWEFGVPLIYGGDPRDILWLCEYGAPTTLPKQPTVVPLGTPVPRSQYNILDRIENLPAGLAATLTSREREEMLEVFVLGLDALYTLRDLAPDPLVEAARADLEASVTHLTSHPVHAGQAKWSALQAAEKMIKAVIAVKNGKYGYTHNLADLAALAATVGLPAVDPAWIASLQTKPLVRYGELPVSAGEAVAAHHASLRVVVHTAAHLPQKKAAQQ